MACRWTKIGRCCFWVACKFTSQPTLYMENIFSCWDLCFMFNPVLIIVVICCHHGQILPVFCCQNIQPCRAPCMIENGWWGKQYSTLQVVSKRASWTDWLELFTFRITNLIDVDGFVYGNWHWKEQYATRLETTRFDYSTRLNEMIKKQRKAKKSSSVWWKRFGKRWALIFLCFCEGKHLTHHRELWLF